MYILATWGSGASLDMLYFHSCYRNMCEEFSIGKSSDVKPLWKSAVVMFKSTWLRTLFVSIFGPHQPLKEMYPFCRGQKSCSEFLTSSFARKQYYDCLMFEIRCELEPCIGTEIPQTTQRLWERAVSPLLVTGGQKKQQQVLGSKAKSKITTLELKTITTTATTATTKKTNVTKIISKIM